MTDAEVRWPPLSLHAVARSACAPADAHDPPATSRVKVVLLSQGGDRARTVDSVVASARHSEHTRSTLQLSERDVVPLLDTSSGNNDGGADTKSLLRRCAVSPFVEWHSAPLPTWFPLPGSVAAAMATLDVARDSVSIVVFQEGAAVVASERDLFVGTLPQPLDSRVYAWPVALGMRATGAHGYVWLDMDAEACDAVFSAWLAGDTRAPLRATHRCETDMDSSAWSTDDEPCGDGGLVPSTTDDERNDGTPRTKRARRAGATADKKRRRSSADSNRAGAGGSASHGKRGARGENSQPNTTDDDDDSVGHATQRRVRASERTRRRSTVGSDDDDSSSITTTTKIRPRHPNIEGDDDDDNADADNAYERSGGSATPTGRGVSGGAGRRRKDQASTSSSAIARGRRDYRHGQIGSRQYARANVFEEDSDDDICAPDDEEDDAAAAAEDDQCDDEVDMGDRDDDLNNDDDDDAEIDDVDLDGEDEAADDTADCDVDDDEADDEDDLMDEDPNAE
ncbi:Transcription termination factor rho-like domain-containing protein [Pandoravirus kuranda]|uniref:Transcription termination factor rho-like domain-containing protein n=1 Tax=Pandoravirus kuranda TaxID=3019033 RepID=A0AA95J6H9_9VIRU|nr:Transcription termination factor rho-like domain-containing protein [Pandoravirus kuranda]